MTATSHDLRSDGEALLVVCSSSSMTTPTTNNTVGCLNDQQRPAQSQVNAGSDSGAHAALKKRSSGIPTTRRSPSLSHLNAAGAPKWRTGARTATTPEPSVGVSTIYAEPEHVHLQDASRMASRLSASVVKRASRDSMSRQAEGMYYVLDVA